MKKVFAGGDDFDEDFDEANFRDDFEEGEDAGEEDEDQAIDDTDFKPKKSKAKKQLFDDAEVEDDVFAEGREALLGDDDAFSEDDDDDK